MDPNFAQRRRVFVAVAITLVAVPAAFLLGRDDSRAEAPSTTIVTPIVPPSATSGPPPSEHAADRRATGGTFGAVLGTTPVGYLDGTVAPEANDPPVIRVPRPRDTVMTGQASVSTEIDDTAICHIAAVPMGVEATVTNLDNSHSLKCAVVAIAKPQPADVMLHPEAFAQIADPTEAPVPVEVSW